MTHKLDYRLVAPGIMIVASSYGLARYAYGLFLPVFRQAFGLNDSKLAYIAAVSYASYFLITLAGIYLSTRLAPRISVLLGGAAAALGMGMIALAQSPLMLATGVAIAGVSPGLAYTPFSEIIATLVSEPRQRRIYSLVNSGTSLGVMLSGPAAILFGEHWRLAWGLFALFAFVATLWCAMILPRMTARSTPLSFEGVNIRTLTAGGRGRLFAIAFLIGVAASVYLAFSVDLVTAGAGGSYQLPGFTISASLFGQLFWSIVGLAGFAGIMAGNLVERLGLIPAMRLFLIALAAATALLALSQSAAAVLLSGLVFGAFFVFLAASLGMWSFSLFRDLPAVGFGLTFLLLSAGQFIGPLLVGMLIGRFSLGQIFIASAVFSAVLTVFLPHQRSPAAASR